MAQPAAQLPDTIADDDRFVDTTEAARILCLSADTLVTWRNRNPDGPPFYRLATNKVVYLRSELFAWMRQFRVGAQITPPLPAQAPRPWE